MERRLGEYLRIRDHGGRPAIFCRCGHKICGAEQDFKEFVACSEFPLTRASPRNSVTDRFALREFYCPVCATLLEVEVAQKGEPFVRSYNVTD